MELCKGFGRSGGGKVKRIFSLILAAALTVSILAAGAAAAQQPGLSVTAALSDDGSIVTATVHVTQTEALAGLQFTLNYDSSLMSVTGDPVVGGAAAKMSYICNPNTKEMVALVAYSATAVQNDGGDLLTVKFAVKSGASGSTELRLTECELVDNDVKDIAIGTPVAASITLKAPSQAAVVTEPGVVTSKDLDNTDAGTSNPQDSTASSAFSDCRGHWAESYIAKAAEAGLVNGMGGGLYKPDTNMTRAQFVTILWRYAGSPEPTAAASFTDLDKTQTWYMKAVAWAYEKGIVNGIGAGRFGPNGLVTREQMMTILFRYSGQTPGIEQGLYAGAFRDGDQISPWAKTALYWAVYNNVYCGVSAVSAGDTLAPGGKATRAQIAVVMVKYSEAFSK